MTHSEIHRFLDELRARLGPDDARTERRVREAEAHLEESLDRLVRSGEALDDAAGTALERFGSVDDIVLAYERDVPARCASDSLAIRALAALTSLASLAIAAHTMLVPEGATSTIVAKLAASTMVAVAGIVAFTPLRDRLRSSSGAVLVAIGLLGATWTIHLGNVTGDWEWTGLAFTMIVALQGVLALGIPRGSRHRFASGVLLVSSLALAPAARAFDVDVASVDADVARWMSRYGVPGLGLALVMDGRVILAKGYGVRSTATGEPVTEATSFPIGSVSKAFTSLVALQLVEEKRLDLDSPIAGSLPSVAFADPAMAKSVTLRRLLSHTSGWPTLPEWPLPSREAIVKKLAETPLESPGSWRYCNQNFVLAGHLVETIAGKRFEDQIRERIFRPLGMTQAGFDLAARPPESRGVAPHRLDVRRGMQPIAFEPHIGPWAPSGGIHASAAELASFAAFQVGDGSWQSRQLLPSTSMAEMHRRQTAVAGHPSAVERAVARWPATNVGYGLGWYVESYRGLEIAEHGGTLDGFTTNVTLVPSRRAAVVLVTNADHADLFVAVARFLLLERLLSLAPEGDLRSDLEARAHFDPRPLEAAKTFRADPASFEKLLGTYRSSGGPEIRVERRGDDLRLSIQGMLEVDLVAFEPNGFLGNSPPLTGKVLTFRIAGDGSVTLHGDGQTLGTKPAAR